MGDSFDSASKLEAGDARSVTPANPSEKSTPGGSPTLKANSTLRSSRTIGSMVSTFRRAQSWTANASAILVPQISRGKIKATIPKLEDYPMGYPRLACYLDSDDAFMVYRRFGMLHSRLLLQKQDKLRALEGELFTADKRDEKDGQGQLCLKSREEEDFRQQRPRGCRPRNDIFSDIEQNLLEYGRLLKQAQELTSMNAPHDRDHRSVVNFIENHQPLLEGERDFVYCSEDLVTLRSGRENAWLDAAVEAILRWYPCKPIKHIFCSEESQQKTIDPNIHYFSRSRINFVVTLVITTIILILLVAPIVGLFELTQHQNLQTTDAVCIGILLISTLVFSSVLSMFTKAKRHEILAAAAGYCAVLVVFVGNLSNGNSNHG